MKKRIKTVMDCVETCREKPELIEEIEEPYRGIIKLIDEKSRKLDGVPKPKRVATA